MKRRTLSLSPVSLSAAEIRLIEKLREREAKKAEAAKGAPTCPVCGKPMRRHSTEGERQAWICRRHRPSKYWIENAVVKRLGRRPPPCPVPDCDRTRNWFGFVKESRSPRRRRAICAAGHVRPLNKKEQEAFDTDRPYPARQTWPPKGWKP